MGAITGVVGGVLRDVLCNEIPMVLRKGNLYAAAALFGRVAYVLLQHLGLARQSAAWVGMALVAGLRLASIAFNWTLPEFRLPPEGRP
jgi:uncharacterized membrane protein YeiH